MVIGDRVALSEVPVDAMHGRRMISLQPAGRYRCSDTMEKKLPNGCFLFSAASQWHKLPFLRSNTAAVLLFGPITLSVCYFIQPSACIGPYLYVRGGNSYCVITASIAVREDDWMKDWRHLQPIRK